MTSTLPASWWHDLAPIRLADAVASADGFHRSWVMLMPQRTYKTERYGTLDFSEGELRKYKQSFDANARGVEIALDVDHNAPHKGETAAYGWIERVELGETIGKKPGLWALVRWTPLGLSDVRDQIYRYMSAEITPGKYHNETTGKTYTNVITGATLTNRPVLKDIEPVTLSEVSTRAWGSVDKAKLPDSCFLDPQNRRLPVYEGAGPMVDGKYTKRGKLNIHGVKAALAAVHGARSGKAMTGLPAGIAKRLQGWLDRYSSGGGDGDAGGTSVSASEGRRGVMAADVEDLDLDQAPGDDEDEGEEVALADAELDDSGDDSEDYAEDGDGNDAEDAQDEEEEQEQQQPKAKAKAKGKGGKSMPSKMMSEEDAGTVTMAEHLALVEEVKALKRDKYVAGVERILSGWEAGKLQFSEVSGSRTKVPNPEGQQAKTTTGRSVRVVMSRPAQQRVRAVLLSEEYAALSESLQQQIAAAFEAIATGTVELGVRGGSHDTERQKTTKLTLVKPESDAAAFEAAVLENTVALAEADGEDYRALVKASREPGRAGIEAAAKVQGYQSRAYRQTLAGA